MDQPADFNSIVEAHGITGSLAWVIFFPLGAILIRVVSSNSAIWLHAAVQTIGLLLFIVNFGQGIWQAIVSDQINTYHAIIGIILFGLAIFQPIGGWIHHKQYQKHQHRTATTYVHVWLGRLLITLGIINGGLGLMLGGDATKGEYIAYGVIAAVIWAAYVAIAAFGEVKKPSRKGDDEKMSS